MEITTYLFFGENYQIILFYFLNFSEKIWSTFLKDDQTRILQDGLNHAEKFSENICVNKAPKQVSMFAENHCQQ